MFRILLEIGKKALLSRSKLEVRINVNNDELLLARNISPLDSVDTFANLSL